MFIYKKPLILFLGLFAFLSLGAQFSLTEPSGSAILQKMNQRQGSWIGMQAELSLNFENSSAENHAQCQGKLLYHRLDEKMMLECSNKEGKRLFTFQTDDWQFKLYLPSQKTVYHGNIFDLEESNDLQSHLKPLAFYRALKVMRFTLGQLEVDTWNDQNVFLTIWGKTLGRSYVARKMEMTHEGDVTQEIYYSHLGEPVNTIKRSNYKALKDNLKRKVHFPHKISIINHSQNEQNPVQITSIEFNEVKFQAGFSNQDWKLALPKETKQTTVRGEILPVFAGS